jgi:hypothetical protein
MSMQRAIGVAVLALVGTTQGQNNSPFVCWQDIPGLPLVCGSPAGEPPFCRVTRILTGWDDCPQAQEWVDGVRGATAYMMPCHFNVWWPAPGSGACTDGPYFIALPPAGLCRDTAGFPDCWEY